MTFTPAIAPDAQSAAMSRFERQTGIIGPITMAAGLFFSLLGRAALVFFGGFDVDLATVIGAFGAVAVVFGMLWFIEPLTYFPIVGPGAMYQTFMIGNISNKLIPAVVTAQSALRLKPGSRQADLTAVMAISGAACVHLTSLLVLVGGLGMWLLTVIPEEVIALSQEYILSALLGAVVVQLIVQVRNLRITLIAVACALVMQFVLIPLVPQLAIPSTGIVVFAAIALAWLLRDKDRWAASAE